MHSSFRKLTGIYIVIILLILIITGSILSLSFKEYYINNIKVNLVKESDLAAELIHYNEQQKEKDSFQDICDTLAIKTDTRVTIIDITGKVLADSHFDARNMELHNTRPEVYQALQGRIGDNIRMSDTGNISMLYVAVPFNSSNVRGVVRLSKPLDEVEAIYQQILFIPLLAILIIGLITLFISVGVANKFSRPIKDLTRAVKEMAHGNLKKRINYHHQDDLGVLADAVNSMAENLDRNINEISQVKNRLAALLENTVNGILMVDNGSKVTYANPAALSQLSINKGYLGKKHVEVISNYELIQIIDNVKKECKAIRRNIKLHNKHEKIVEVNVVPLINERMSYNNDILVVLNDITETKRLEQIRKDFVANVSHELKTPVATISGFAETLLCEDKDMPDHIKEFSRIIYDEAQRLKRLIERLMELTKLESDRTELNTQTINMEHLIENSINLFKKRNDLPEQEINFVTPPRKIYIDCDPDFVIQVLINLLDNAVNYSTENKPITITLEERKKDIKICVQDQGEGIPEKEKPRVFERFYRVDKTRSRKTGGTGLGLAIVKHLVENLGGQVGLESSIGEGSIFYFTLPKNRLENNE